ncbi:alpha/beta hydrolase family protein [Paenibacillus kobensis]|uniref:alpha/beta hydrolase family protein n=1 Tax=Paenibacillus kobensis TaxID=59841 RepID=UPI000FD96D6D|nr:dienelactone hydrolase family protein [Paenibacillus kobensis]
MSAPTITAAEFTLHLNGLKVEGRVTSLQDGVPKPVVILNHGFKGHQDWAFWPEVAKKLADSGFYTVSYNFSRLSAARDGLDERQVAAATTLTQEQLDLSAVVQALHEHRLPQSEQADTEKIGLIGHSRAGGSVLVYAFEHADDVKAVVVWNGGAGAKRQASANSEAELSVLEAVLAEDQQLNLDRYNLTDKVPSLTTAALFIQGDQDREQLLALFESYQQTAPGHHYVLISGANHTFNAGEPYEGASPALKEAVQNTIDFLRVQLS